MFNMTTNATLIHKYIDFIVENNIELLISFDGNEKLIVIVPMQATTKIHFMMF